MKRAKPYTYLPVRRRKKRFQHICPFRLFKILSAILYD